MKTTSQYILILAVLVGCSEPRINMKPEHDPVPTPATASCTQVLLGDKDGFGMNMKQGDALSLKAGTSLPIDHRSSTDPNFTDIYSAEMGGSSSVPYQILYTMSFEKPARPVASARFRLSTLGIQDGDNQVYGVDTDIRVYIDNQEIPHALDAVDQFDMINGEWADFVSTIELEIPANLLYVLNDGKVSVRWEMFQLNPNSQSHEAFAIDYCELEICFTKVQ